MSNTVFTYHSPYVLRVFCSNLLKSSCSHRLQHPIFCLTVANSFYVKEGSPMCSSFRDAVRYCFLQHIRLALQEFTKHHNTHRIRRQSLNNTCGVPLWCIMCSTGHILRIVAHLLFKNRDLQQRLSMRPLVPHLTQSHIALGYMIAMN